MYEMIRGLASRTMFPKIGRIWRFVAAREPQFGQLEHRMTEIEALSGVRDTYERYAQDWTNVKRML
jgi:hypothetical protein